MIEPILYLIDVRLCSPFTTVLPFELPKFVVIVVLMLSILLLLEMRVDFLICYTQELFAFGGLVPKIGLEFRAALVESDSMPEGTYNRVRGGEWEAPRDESDGVHSIPAKLNA